jgi:predicted RNA binding protein YcfA (HicA-like mRNA interferase family)
LKAPKFWFSQAELDKEVERLLDGFRDSEALLLENAHGSRENGVGHFRLRNKSDEERLNRMKLPRNLDGEELAKPFCKRWGYAKIHRVGSHIILQTEHPIPHRIAIPAHHPLKVGTLNAILADVAAHKNALKEAVLNDR